MTFDELDALVRRGVEEIGVDTISHPVLPFLGDDEARATRCVCRTRSCAIVANDAAVGRRTVGLHDYRTANIARSADL